MSSKRRIEASRRNGSHSRGPITEEGKRRSSRNSLRHGILANTVVLEGEDQNVFIEFLSTLEDELNPSDQTERDLVETMAVARWRIMRLWAMETANLQDEMKKDHTPGRNHPTRAALAFRKLCDESRSSDLLGRYETRYDRQYYRAMNLLLKKRKSPYPVESCSSLAPNPSAPDPVPASSPVEPSELLRSRAGQQPANPPSPFNTNLPSEPNPEIEHPSALDKPPEASQDKSQLVSR